MRIVELNISGFGKFKDTKISLEPGLNLIYGPNESGKSTLHIFINGMFYGLVKPYTKRTVYLDEHRRLNPWYTSSYSGSVIFESKGEIYRIHRVFTKGNEETKVFVEATGEDITGKVHDGDLSRVLQPGEYFFGINSGTFNNTLFVSQQEIRPDKNLASQVRERLVNTITGGNNEISVDMALKHIENQLKEIGSNRAPTSDFGKLSIEIKELRESLVSLSGDVIKHTELMIHYNKALKYLEEIDKEMDLRKSTLDRINLKEKLEAYKDVLRLREKNSNLGLELEKVSGHEGKNTDDLEEVLALEGDINLFRSRIRSYMEQLEEKDERISRLFLANSQLIQQREGLVNDGHRFQKLESLRGGDEDIHKLKKKLSDFKNRQKLLLFSILITLFIYISANIYFYSNGSDNLGRLTQILILPIAYGILLMKSDMKTLGDIQKDIDLETEKNQLLQKYQFEDKFHFLKAFEAAKADIARAEKDKELYMELEGTRNAIGIKIREIKEEMEASTRKLQLILSRNGENDVTSFKEGLLKKSMALEIKREISHNNDMINRILKNEDMAHLEELAELHPTLSTFEDNTDSVEINDSYNKLKKTKEDLLKEISRMEGSLSQLGKSVEHEIVLKESIENLEYKKSQIEIKKKSLEFASERIRKISGEIHREYAPAISRRIGDFLGEITKGRYSSVRMDKNLEFGIVDSESNRIVSVEELSGGTIDQLYLGLRLGVLEEFTSRELPLFLDECFTQYDDKRLERILEHISDLSGERQVVLMTCQNREEQILDQFNIEYNKINLHQI